MFTTRSLGDWNENSEGGPTTTGITASRVCPPAETYRTVKLAGPWEKPAVASYSQALPVRVADLRPELTATASEQVIA